MNTNPKKEPSRQFILRLPASLYSEVRDQAAEEGISLNTWLAVLIAGQLSFRKSKSKTQ
jgi:predicted HicB family RNase H-like nuclease